MTADIQRSSLFNLKRHRSVLLLLVVHSDCCMRDLINCMFPLITSYLFSFSSTNSAWYLHVARSLALPATRFPPMRIPRSPPTPWKSSIPWAVSTSHIGHAYCGFDLLIHLMQDRSAISGDLSATVAGSVGPRLLPYGMDNLPVKLQHGLRSCFTPPW